MSAAGLPVTVWDPLNPCEPPATRTERTALTEFWSEEEPDTRIEWPPTANVVHAGTLNRADWSSLARAAHALDSALATWAPEHRAEWCDKMAALLRKEAARCRREDRRARLRAA